MGRLWKSHSQWETVEQLCEKCTQHISTWGSHTQGNRASGVTLQQAGTVAVSLCLSPLCPLVPLPCWESAVSSVCSAVHLRTCDNTPASPIRMVFKLSNPKYYHKLTAITYSLSSRSFLHVFPQPRIHSVLSCHLQGLAPRSPPSLIFCQVPQALSFPPNSFHYLEYMACWIWLTPDYLYFFSPAEF